MDFWLLISDWSVVMLVLLGAGVGFLLGWSVGSAGQELHSIYVQDDGQGGINDVTDIWGPDKPKPGDPLYMPEKWLSDSEGAK